MDFNFQNINVGVSPGGQGDGDLVREAFIKVNENFDLIKLQLEDFDPSDIQQQLDDLQDEIDGNSLDISDLMNQLLVINNQLSNMIPDDAPSDGKQYGRKDGQWEEITGGGSTSDDISNESDVDGVNVTEALNNLDTNKIDTTPDGINNLIDVDNKLNPVYLPPNIMHLQGEWNAATNTPTLSNGTGVAGYIYEVTTAGTTDFGDGDIEFALGDWVVYGGDGKWYKSPNTGEVVGVKGDNESAYRKGLVNLDIDDIIEPTANQFLVGNSTGTDWEKRGITGADVGITAGGTNMIPVWTTNSNQWITPLKANETPKALTVPIRTTNPNPGRVKGNNAIETDDLVPLGQLNTVLEDYIQEPTTDGTSGQVLTTDGSGGISWQDVSGGSGLPPSEEGKFLVGGASDWEKRGIIGNDVNIPQASGSRVPVWIGTSWAGGGFPMSAKPTANTIASRKSDSGALEVGTASDTNDAVPLGQLNTILGDYVSLTGNQTVADVKTFTSSPIVPTATTPTQAVNLGQMTLQGVLDNNNVADGVGIMLTDGSSVGQYYAESVDINVGTTGIAMSKAQEGFLYSGANGRVHLGDRDGVVGLNFETLTNKMNIVPPASFGTATHTLQNKSGTLAHLEDIGDVADGSVTNAKLANMPANSIKGRASGTGIPSDITILANSLVGRGSMGNLTGLTVGGGLFFSGTQLNSDIYRDNYELSPVETQDTWTDDRIIQKVTFTGTSTGEQQIDLTSFGIDSIILIEGMYVANDNSREVPCNYQRLLTPATNADIEVTTCYRNSSTNRLYLSWHDVLSGTVRPVEFTYNVTIKYVK